MSGADNPIRRAGALILLVMLAVIALRGFLPGVAEPPVRDPQAGGGGFASLVVMLFLCVSSALFILLGIIGGRRKRLRMPVELSRVGGRPLRMTGREAAVAAAIVLVGMLVLGAPLFVGRPTYEGNHSVQSPGTAAQQPSGQPGQPGETFSDTPFVIAAAVLLVGIALLSTVVLARSPVPPADEPEEPEEPSGPQPQPAGSLARAAELGLAEVIEPGRDPRAAIIACYSAMERGLAEAPDAAPLASDTPSEVLARAVDHGALHSHAAAQLVELFTEARFSPHRMTEKHRESAVEWLGLVLDDLRSRR
jgi:hypothetical protein